MRTVLLHDDRAYNTYYFSFSSYIFCMVLGVHYSFLSSSVCECAQKKSVFSIRCRVVAIEVNLPLCICTERVQCKSLSDCMMNDRRTRQEHSVKQRKKNQIMFSSTVQYGKPFTHNKIRTERIVWPNSNWRMLSQSDRFVRECLAFSCEINRG